MIDGNPQLKEIQNVELDDMKVCTSLKTCQISLWISKWTE